MIGTLESYRKTRDYFGCGKLVPLYVEVEDGERLSRALERERQQNNPKYVRANCAIRSVAVGLGYTVQLPTNFLGTGLR